MTEGLSEEEKQIIREIKNSSENVHGFFTRIIEHDDTTKTGNLTQEELGMPNLPLRTHKELALFCEEVYPHKHWENFFNKQAEILTSTSLSKDGVLINLAVTQKRQSSLSDTTPPRKENKGWFGKRKEGEGGQ